MKQTVLIIAGIYGMVSVILGALGAHALKKIISAGKLSSFDTGVKYQMYHALALLFIGMYFSFQNSIEKTMAWCFIVGVFFFSVSIYLLSMSQYWGVNLKFLGPITPIGGVLLIVGWAIMVYLFSKNLV